MADDTTIALQTGGDAIATRDTGTGHKVQRTIPAFGATGEPTDVSAANPLPVAGTVTADTELPAAAALADNNANPTAPLVGDAKLVFDNATASWARERNATSANGTAQTSVGVSGTAILGSDGANYRLAKTTGAGDLSTAAGYAEFTGSASAVNVDIVSQDVSAYRWVTVQLTGTWVGTVAWHASQDNVNWSSMPLMGQTGLSAGAVLNATTNGLFTGPLPARYFRLRVLVYTSGTVAANVGFSTRANATAGVSLVGNNPAIAVDSELPAAAQLADGMAVPTTPTVAAAGMLYNNNTYDRQRNIAAVNGTVGGLGIAATAAMGLDSGNAYRAVKVDAAGTQVVSFPSPQSVQFSSAQPVDTELPAAGVLADATANPTTTTAGAANMVMNASANWERVRTATAANATAGTGLVGAGAMGYDSPSSLFRRLLCDSVGVLQVSTTPSTYSGWSKTNMNTLAMSMATIKSGPAAVGGWQLYNPNASIVYLGFWDASTLPTLGTTSPTYVIAVPASSTVAIEFTNGINHTLGLYTATTTTYGGSTAPAASLIGVLLYK